VQAAQALHLLKDLTRGASESDTALIQDHNAVRVHSLAHEVRHRHDRDALLTVEPPHNRQHFGAAERIEHCCCLVQHQHVGLHRQHAGDTDALLLPAGKLMCGALTILLHLHAVERPIDAAQNFWPRHAQIFRAKGDILLNDGRYDLVVGVLKDHADGVADGAQAGALLRVPRFDPDIAGRGQEQRVEMLCQRRLAGAVVPQQHDIFALLDGQIDASQRRHNAAVALVGVVEIFNANNGRHSNPSTRSGRCDAPLHRRRCSPAAPRCRRSGSRRACAGRGGVAGDAARQFTPCAIQDQHRVARAENCPPPCKCQQAAGCALCDRARPPRRRPQ
jgi:hypothetical protein